MQFIPVIAIMPPGHGKTTMHDPSKGWIDAGSIIADKSVLRSMRKQARERNDWTRFDKYWLKLLNESIPKGTLILMCPSREIAVGFEALEIVTYAMDREYLESVIKERPKSGFQTAMSDYEKAIGNAVVLHRVHDHDELRADLEEELKRQTKMSQGDVAIIRTARLPNELIAKICSSNLRLLVSAFAATLIDRDTFIRECNGTDWDDFSDYWAALWSLGRGEASDALEGLVRSFKQIDLNECEKVIDPYKCWAHQGWHNRVEYKLAQCKIYLSQDARDAIAVSSCYNLFSNYHHSEVICRNEHCRNLSSFGRKVSDFQHGLFGR